MGKTADKMLQEFAPLREQFWGGHVWARGYFGCSSGNVTDPVIAAYIANQGEPGPEDFRVRRMSAITLGRLKAKETVETLRTHKTTIPPPHHYACHWAIAQITGEPMPRPETTRKVRRDWFLSPAE